MMNIHVKKRIKHYSIFGLLLFFLLTPFEYPLSSLGIGSILSYVGVLTIGLAIIDLFIVNKIRYDYRIILLTLWLILELCSGIWAIDSAGYSYYGMIYFRNALMFLLITIIPYNTYEADLCNKAIVLGSILFIGYMALVPGATVYSEWQHRLTIASNGVELLDQNYLAALFIMPVAIVFNRILSNKDRLVKKLFYCMYCFAALVVVLLTGSRSGLLAMLIIIILSLQLDVKKKIISIVVFAILVFIAIPYVVTLMSPELLDRFSLEAFAGKTTESGSRFMIWNAAFRSLSNPIRFCVGYGAGSSAEIVARNCSIRAAVHNHYLALLVECGILGFSIFTTLTIKMLLKLKKSINKELVIGFCGIMLIAFFIDVLTTKFFWSAMMLITIRISSAKDNRAIVQ